MKQITRFVIAALAIGLCLSVAAAGPATLHSDTSSLFDMFFP